MKEQISKDVLSTEYLGQDKPVNKINPVVSVCVITYKHAAFIEECLDSILMQETDFPFEIIIGEDNSTDGTREICKRYADQHPDKIRLFLRRLNHKIEVNGNKTFHFNLIENLKAARGEYIALCEGDDYWLVKDKLQKQVKLSNEKSLWAVFGRTLHLRNGEKKEVTDDLSTILNDGVVDLNKVDRQKWLFGHTSTYFFKNALVENIISDSLLYKVAGTNNVVFFHAIQNKNVGFINQHISVYRHHPGGVTKAKQNFAERETHTINKLEQYQALYSKTRVMKANLKYMIYFTQVQLLSTSYFNSWQRLKIAVNVLLHGDVKYLKKVIKAILR